jgi:peptidoglycan hydrolase-like protein with peptidoglycan-binding domain
LGYKIAETGVGSPGNETEYFGNLTRKALAKFQADNKIYPAVGYFGPKTKALLALKGF